MVLKDDVLNRFQKYKEDYNLSNILYGKKAIEKMASVFYPHDINNKKKWIKKMISKSDNSVYFVYISKKKSKSHRFLAPDSDLGQSFVLSQGSNIKKRRSVKSRKNQKGGYPFWFDDVPKGMSRSQYLKLKKSKPKNKSMKVWIRENKKKTNRNRKRSSTRRSRRGV